MNVGIIGLGKMGHAIAQRVITNGEVVYGFDTDHKARAQAQQIGVELVDAVSQLPKKTDLIWLMLPAGQLVDKIIQELLPHLQPESIIIDGGNSYFKDSIQRATLLQQHSIYFLDCGTSGGLRGQELGFSLMVGGKKEAYNRVVPLFRAIGITNGYNLVGPSGAGHYVKMIHNGIEYGLLQAYAEGFHLLKEGSFKQENLDLAKITELWMHGSIIRSYLVELSHEVFSANQDLENVSGYIAESGMGAWTAAEADANNIPTPVLKESLQVRSQSREPHGGNFATKVVALLRHAFGGHPVEKK